MLSRARRSAVALCALSILALFVLPAAARAGVIVVDISGGGEFTSLPAALASALDGDTLLIRPGDYSAQATVLTINNRTVTLAADGTGPVITPPLRVTVADGAHRVLLRGLQASAAQTASSVSFGLEVLFAGDVMAEDCVFVGRDGEQAFAAPAPGRAGISVFLGHVVLKNCSATGGRGADTIAPSDELPSSGGPGLDVQQGSVQVYGGSYTGGSGGDIVGFPTGAGPGPNSGGSGIDFYFSGSLVAGASLTGGVGGNGDDLAPLPVHHSGGDALRIQGVHSVEVQGNVLVPGLGGFAGNGAQGSSGSATDLAAGASLVTHPGPYRSYSLGAPTPEGSSLQLNYTGVAGDMLAIFLSTQSGLVPLPAKQGVWHLGAPLFGPYILSAPSGTLSLSIPIAGAGLGPEGAVLLYEQIFVKPASGAALLSSPSTHLIVDGSL